MNYAALPARFVTHAGADAEATIREIFRTAKLPQNVFGVTEDGKIMFKGDVLFHLKATHGFPLDFALDKIITQNGMAVDWPAFIHAARDNGWWDFQSYEVIMHALVDAEIDKRLANGIRLGFQHYVMDHPLIRPIFGGGGGHHDSTTARVCRLKQFIDSTKGTK